MIIRATKKNISFAVKLPHSHYPAGKYDQLAASSERYHVNKIENEFLYIPVWHRC